MNSIVLNMSSPINREDFMVACVKAREQSSTDIKKVSINPHNFNELVRLGRKQSSIRKVVTKSDMPDVVFYGIEICCDSNVDRDTLKFYFEE